MGWARLALLVVVAWLVAQALRAARRRFGSPPPKQLDSRKMVQCAVCEIYVPETSATERGGRFYCGEQHADQGTGPG